MTTEMDARATVDSMRRALDARALVELLRKLDWDTVNSFSEL